MRYLLLVVLISSMLPWQSCQSDSSTGEDASGLDSTALAMQTLLGKYTSFKLTTDISALSPSEKQMIPILIDVAKIMDSLFWFRGVW